MPRYIFIKKKEKKPRYIKCLYICYIVENYCIVLNYAFMRGLHLYDRTGVVRDHAITALIYYS